MGNAAVAWELGRLQKLVGGMEPPAAQPALEAIRADRTAVLRLAGLTPDPWQVQLLTSPSSPNEQTAILTGRQMGKSTVAAGLALATALLDPALVLLLSPVLRQSQEIFRKVTDLYHALGGPVRATAETALRLELANGSRIISLPGTETTIRGYSAAALLIIDEAARVPDDLYRSVRPMLAVSGGRLVALTTPFGKRGWFYREWTEGDGWKRVEITARECPRITAAFLEKEKRSLGDRWFAQEYGCSFEEDTSAFFSHEEILRAFPDEVPDRRVIVFPED